MEYLRSLDGECADDECFLCRYWSDPAGDGTNHVIWRGRSAFVCMNRFPYTNGHLLIAHAMHKGELAALADEDLFELTRMIRDAVALLRETVHAQGFNVGYNVGACAGAGLPGHLHAHVVPRWGGDPNARAVRGESYRSADASSGDGRRHRRTSSAKSCALALRQSSMADNCRSVRW